jgi:hypothetical protein
MGHHMQRMGHHIQRMGHHMQRLGDKRTFFVEGQFIYEVNNAAGVGPKLGYCRGSPASIAHGDDYTKHFLL